MNKIMSLVFITLFSTQLFSMRDQNNENNTNYRVVSRKELRNRIKNSGVMQPSSQEELDAESEKLKTDRYTTPQAPNRPKKNTKLFN